jgi:hypothetical protein
MMINGRIATSIVMLSIFSGMTYLALGFPDKAAFTPMLVGIPGIILCMAQLVIDVSRRKEVAGSAKGVATEEHDQNAINRREWFMFVWLAIFAGATIGFGFHIGGSAVVFLYIRFGEDESWRNAIVAGVGTFLVIWLIFTKLLELPLFSGLLLPTLF